MVLLPGCTCCGGANCFLAEPLPEWIEVSVNFGAASGIGSATTNQLARSKNPPAEEWYRTSTTSITHTAVANQSGKQIVRLNYASQGNFTGYNFGDGTSINATISGGFLSLNFDVAKDSMTLVRNFTEQGSTTTTTGSDSRLRGFVVKFFCFGCWVSIYPNIVPNLTTFPVSTYLQQYANNSKKVFCGDLVASDFAVSKPAESLFPLAFRCNWAAYFTTFPYSESYEYLQNLLFGGEKTGSHTFGSGKYSIPPPSVSIGEVVEYGYTTSTTVEDVWIKKPGAEAFSIGELLSFAKTDWYPPELPSSCSEWLTISV